VNGRANLAALDRRFARAMVTRDQQQDALAAVNGQFEGMVDRVPRAVQIHSVKIEHPVGRNIA
jgi:hypothetical protein